MSGIRIVTDSACDLTDEELTEYGIEMVPLTIRFGDEEFVDRVELSIAEFYRRLAESDHLPETSAPAPGKFAEVFQRLLDDGAEAIVCINLSAALSATMQAAETAVKELEGDPDIRVIDSRSITAGLGAMVLAAAQAAATGATADEIEALVEDLSARTRVYGVLDTLENLKKGGRIGNAQALLGSMLSIKPALDLSSGEVEEAGKVRTRKKSLAWLRDKVASETKIEKLAIMHSMADDADTFRDLLSEVTDVEDLRVGPIGAVIGTHGGPGVMGVAYVLAP
ncbi:MAG: DegV family protein [Acidimicrobiia bacterium]|nr:DegV family protein [Acidimicrobiia bacterium]MDH5236242.1 DegV family protein [Acidimicrobiia bacterium]